MSNDVEMTVRFPSELKKRLKRICERRGMTVSNLVREATIEKCDHYDRLQAEEELLRERNEAREREEKEYRRLQRTPLAPVTRGLSPRALEAKRPAPPQSRDRFEPLYEKHAKRLAEVVDRPVDLRRRKDEAVAEFKREAPLTRPSDDEIYDRLEERVRALIAGARVAGAAAAGEGVDDLVGKELDTSRIRSAGDVHHPLLGSGTGR